MIALKYRYLTFLEHWRLNRQKFWMIYFSMFQRISHLIFIDLFWFTKIWILWGKMVKIWIKIIGHKKIDTLELLLIKWKTHGTPSIDGPIWFDKNEMEKESTENTTKKIRLNTSETNICPSIESAMATLWMMAMHYTHILHGFFDLIFCWLLFFPPK